MINITFCIHNLSQASAFDAAKKGRGKLNIPLHSYKETNFFSHKEKKSLSTSFGNSKQANRIFSHNDMILIIIGIYNTQYK